MCSTECLPLSLRNFIFFFSNNLILANSAQIWNNKPVPLLCGLLIHLNQLSFLFGHYFLTGLCPLSASTKICCAPNWGACTYVALGSWCRSADRAALAATTVASPWILTVGRRPSGLLGFPLHDRSVPLTQLLQALKVLLTNSTPIWPGISFH